MEKSHNITAQPAAGKSPIGLRALVQQAKKEHGSTERLTALLALSDNGNDVTCMDGVELWEDGAVIIAGLMESEDEARFTLYDYIDALYNTDLSIISDPPRWLRLLCMAHRENNTHLMHKMFLQLTELAMDRRRMYSSD